MSLFSSKTVQLSYYLMFVLHKYLAFRSWYAQTVCRVVVWPSGILQILRFQISVTCKLYKYFGCLHNNCACLIIYTSLLNICIFYFEFIHLFFSWFYFPFAYFISSYGLIRSFKRAHLSSIPSILYVNYLNSFYRKMNS